MVKLLEHPYTNHLTELFQANEVKFAFVNKSIDNDEITFTPVHVWVKCREYFNELLMSNHHKDFKIEPIYGFKYNPTEFPLDLSATRIALKFPTKTALDNFEKSLPWLHAIEEYNNLDKTIIHSLEENSLIKIVEGSSVWVQTCLLTNLYTLLLKLMCHKINTNTSITSLPDNASECSFLYQISSKVFNNFISNVKYLTQTPSKYIDGTNKIREIHEIHGNSGIMNLLQKRKVEIAHPEEIEKNKLSPLYSRVKHFFTDNPTIEFLKA